MFAFPKHRLVWYLLHPEHQGLLLTLTIDSLNCSVRAILLEYLAPNFCFPELDLDVILHETPDTNFLLTSLSTVRLRVLFSLILISSSFPRALPVKLLFTHIATSTSFENSTHSELAITSVRNSYRNSLEPLTSFHLILSDTGGIFGEFCVPFLILCYFHRALYES